MNEHRKLKANIANIESSIESLNLLAELVNKKDSLTADNIKSISFSLRQQLNNLKEHIDCYVSAESDDILIESINKSIDDRIEKLVSARSYYTKIK